MEVNDEAVKDAVRRACEEVGLPPAYRFAVSQLLRTPPTDWPTCCGEGCFPCSQSLADAATRALELLGQPLPAR
jgi:hypothetical protein